MLWCRRGSPCSQAHCRGRPPSRRVGAPSRSGFPPRGMGGACHASTGPATRGHAAWAGGARARAARGNGVGSPKVGELVGVLDDGERLWVPHQGPGPERTPCPWSLIEPFPCRRRPVDLATQPAPSRPHDTERRGAASLATSAVARWRSREAPAGLSAHRPVDQAAGPGEISFPADERSRLEAAAGSRGHCSSSSRTPRGATASLAAPSGRRPRRSKSPRRRRSWDSPRWDRASRPRGP